MRFMFSQHPDIAKRWVSKYGEGYIGKLKKYAKPIKSKK